MDGFSWNSVIQAVIMAACTWYVRKASHRDSQAVQRSTAAQSTSDEILKRITLLEQEVSLIKEFNIRYFGVDHRGPKPT